MRTALHGLMQAGDRLQHAVGMGPFALFSAAWTAGWVGIGVVLVAGMTVGSVEDTRFQHLVPLGAFQHLVELGSLLMAWLIGLGLVLAGAHFRREVDRTQSMAPEIGRVTAWRLMLLDYDQHGRLLLCFVMGMLFAMGLMVPFSGWLHLGHETRKDVFLCVLGVFALALARGLWNMRPVSGNKLQAWQQLPGAVRQRMETTVGTGQLSVPLIDCAVREHAAIMERVAREAAALEATTPPANGPANPRRL